MRNWTGNVLVGRNATLKQLLERPEVSQPGVYILQGPDPEVINTSRIYIGESENVAQRLPNHAKTKEFWEQVCVITVTDESLTKGHIGYLEGRLVELAESAKRASLDNKDKPKPGEKPLPEADRAYMEEFLEHFSVLLPVVGFDFLKPVSTSSTATTISDAPLFELRHKKRSISASAREIDGEFTVLAGSEAIAEGGYVTNSYSGLREKLKAEGVLEESENPEKLVFSSDVSFSSPSAAAAVVFDRNANGRTWWKVADTKMSYHEWQLGLEDKNEKDDDIEITEPE